jgi:tetratricopeptide (TPR) repeat protein
LGGKDYEKADALYDKVIEKKPKIYLYKKLKGQNLIDWGVQEETRLDEAYQIFNSEFSENRRNTDPLFQMLKITIMKEDNENINFLYSLLQKKFPLAVDSEVYTKLASYFVTESLRDPKNSPLDPVRDILASVIERYPGYPKAYFTLSLYHKILNNKEEEERLLKATILYERERPLEYPWEYRDRDLISDAFNNLGELYQRIEIPGKTAEAINYFNKAIEENPENKKAYFNLAQAYFYDEKNYSRAQRYYEIAKKLGYADRDLDYNLGLVYFYGKKFERALNQWAKLTELEPDNPNINFAMGSVFLHMNKYNAALGELLLLAELYGELVKDLGEIKPWSAYHKRIVLSGASVYNNLGVAYQKLYEATGKSGYQRDSLLYLYKAGELADIIGTERGPIQYNINYIIHPNVSRSEMAINDNISENYRFVTQ